MMKNGCLPAHGSKGPIQKYLGVAGATSVPYKYIGKKIKILYTSTLAEVFYRYIIIASHARS